jgi:anti-sigma regulatory factor (Ser/Thr protein kinase)
MVDEPAADPGEMKHQLVIMDEQARRMLNLVDDLLTLSRLEDETQAPREEEFDVRDLIYDVSAEGRRLSAGRHSITCEVVPAFLKGSREELRSAFSNLVSNAVRYTPEGGRILLHWEMREGKGVFSVEDSGIGIPEEHIPRLTERFYRVDRGRSRESGGTGLGLSIIKHILLRHQAAWRSLPFPAQAAPSARSSRPGASHCRKAEVRRFLLRRTRGHFLPVQRMPYRPPGGRRQLAPLGAAAVERRQDVEAGVQAGRRCDPRRDCSSEVSPQYAAAVEGRPSSSV